MDIQKIQDILQIVGAVAIAVPALISAALAIALVIPGEQPDKFLDKALGLAEKAAEFLKGFSRKPPQE